MNMQKRFLPASALHHRRIRRRRRRRSLSLSSGADEQRKFERLDVLVSIINDDEQRRERAAQVR